MAVSHKRKRKIIYKDKLYLWYIVPDDDYHFLFYLKIISDDQTLHLSYETDQASNIFIQPRIGVMKSEKLKEGGYKFSPRIQDKVFSNYNVKLILEWHDSQDGTVSPEIFKMPKNPFEDIDFKIGTIVYIVKDFSRSNLKSDMLEVSYPFNYTLTAGWHGSERGYHITIIKNNDHENPVAKTHESYFELEEATISAVAMIENWINEQK
ncbi:hypothetical protein GCM10023210_30300 [Chryseobacterium ginsengisoli]|uniref:Uncharacterized protein n=2 Tax=Chryseobacterium ginsengisoli TaxID=363853 RepID=A0ABP9MGZ5_9FLAO